MITKIHYNWHQVGDNNSGIGEDYHVCEVGIKDTMCLLEVVTITEHRAAGEGDKWFYDVFFIDGTSMRVFNPNLVFKNKD